MRDIMNFLKLSIHVHIFTNLLFACYFFKTTTKPSSVTSHSATFLAHVSTNDLENYGTSGILYFSLGDHFTVFS